MTTDIAAQADRAYELFCRGMRDGQWQGFRDLLDDEVDLLWPYPPSAGQYGGVDGKQKLMVFLDQFGGKDNQITEIEIVNRIVCQDRVVYEDRGRGTIFNQPYEGRHCVILTMHDDRVAGFHEYTARMA
jgi:ketosteroid isomerase-like protein